MHRIALTYQIGDAHDPGHDLHHPLMALLAAVHETGSIGGAALRVGWSYRHTWGELKRWEAELGQPLVRWVKGQRAQLAPFGEKLLWAERRARARLAPQIEALKSELERAFAIAFDPGAGVITLSASHDDALPLLRETASQSGLHLEIAFTGSVDALAALNDGRCLLAGFHALTDSPRGSPTARVYRPMLKPGRHKLVSFARRRQGLIVAAGNPLGVAGLADLPRLRFVNRARGSGTRVVLEQLLAAARVDPSAIAGYDGGEPSHRASAEAVASGSADAGFGIESAARALGLDFITLAEEQYFLVALQPALDHPHVQALLAQLRGTAWQERLAALPGYRALASGEVLSLRRVLPWWSYRKPKR
jgi:putative molybdopterin biosynthesis protein